MAVDRRPIVIPAVNAYEEIRSIEEFPYSNTNVGWVRVSIALVNSNGVPVAHQYKQYEIKDADYRKLTGPATPDLPGKPAGTYRNEDLWHFIDLQRSRGRV